MPYRSAKPRAPPPQPRKPPRPTSLPKCSKHAANQPIVKISAFKDPVIIESIELLQKGKDHFVRVRSKDGAEGISVDDGRMDVLHPILNRSFPYFIGKDARDLEEHLSRAIARATITSYWARALGSRGAGRIRDSRHARPHLGKSLGQLVGGVRTTMPFYVASGRRDTTPEQEIDYLKSLVEKTGAKALKFRVGGRMSRNEDAMPGRTDRLIPLLRKVLGDKMAIHADANSSYDPPQAIEVGRMLEDIGAIHYEEPCPFDNFDDTKKSPTRWTSPSRWRTGIQPLALSRSNRHRVADIVQPDLYYYGGMIRSRRVARMAERATWRRPHLSGGFGFVYSLHFAPARRKSARGRNTKKAWKPTANGSIRR